MTPRPATASPPSSFANQVNHFYSTNFKPNAAATKALWLTFVHAEPAFAKRFAGDSFGATTQLLKLMARLAPQYRRNSEVDASGGKGKGKGKGEPAPTTKGKGKGAGKGQATPFTDLNIPLECFKDKDGTDMPFVDASGLQDGVCGIAHVSHNDADKLMLAYYHNKPFDLPCALLTSAGGSAQLFETRQDLVKRYAVTSIRVPVLRGNAAGSRTVDALLI